ncbi:hypothetical protein DY000_02017108 [Brassica cretica]|uniref:Uncharacterized protein n=1 Tax=Brassica cretica TaxID=69181 RepID=A0ABQ7CQL0_BRACR|nr:hypothetical protein DY000_02017108 [Brassica cretica]
MFEDIWTFSIKRNFWCHWCALGDNVLGEVLPRCGPLKPRLRGSLAEAVSLKRFVKIAVVEDSVLRSPKSLVRSWMMRTKTGSGSITTLMKMVWWDFFLGLEGPDLQVGHSEALSDGVRCGLSLAAFELALCVVELAIVLLPRCGRLKPRLRGSLAEMVSLKRSMKIAAVEDSVPQGVNYVERETVGTQNIPGLENNNDIVAKLTANHLGSVLAKMVFQTTIYHIWRELVLIVIIQSGQRLISLHE